MVHASNRRSTGHALSGTGWNGGNWLLMARVNLFDPERFPAWTGQCSSAGPVPAPCRRSLPEYEERKLTCPDLQGLAFMFLNGKFLALET